MKNTDGYEEREELEGELWEELEADVERAQESLIGRIEDMGRAHGEVSRVLRHGRAFLVCQSYAILGFSHPRYSSPDNVSAGMIPPLFLRNQRHETRNNYSRAARLS